MKAKYRTMNTTALSLLVTLSACGTEGSQETSNSGATDAATGTSTPTTGVPTTGATAGETADMTGVTTGSTDAQTGGLETGTTHGETESETGDPGTEVTVYDVEPGRLSNDVMPGFCEPEIYTKVVDGETQYWLRDNVVGYSDPRPRAFYVDFGYVGKELDYGPIVRGGVYNVRCIRFAGELFWQQPNTLESHVVWFRVPGAMMEAGEVQVPASFQIEDNFIVDQSKLLPMFTAIADKIALVYRWREKDGLADIYGHGATHIYAGGNPGEMDPKKLGVTTAMHVEAPWMATLGVNPLPDSIDGLGEKIFRTLSDAQQDEAVSQQPNVGLYFLDFEKTGNYGDPTTYWSIDLEDETLPRYYRLIKRMMEAQPERITTDYYRAMVWSKGFNSPGDGNPDPTDPKWKTRLEDPEAAIGPAYRKFELDGQTVSLRDLIKVYTMDAYPARGTGPFDGSPDKSDRSWASYQLYSMIYDTIIMRKVIPADARILWFGWSQSDNDQATRLFIDLPTGRASYYVRNPLPASWAQTVEMLGYIVGDGYHWWTEQISKGDDPMHLGTGDGAEQWEPIDPNTPAPWTWSNNPNGEGAYPRMHEYALSYGKLGHYRVKQIEDRLTAWSFVSYTLPDTVGCVANGDQTILDLAANRLPIVLLLGEPGKRALFAVHPFGDYRQRYTLTVDVDGTPTPLTIAGKWPSLVKL